MSKCILVVGMHRSGTSCMAGLLQHSGLFFGKKLLPPSPKNPTGYFENEDLWRLHHSILRAAGHPWDDARPMPAGWEKRLIIRFKRHALKRLIRKHYAGREVFGIKDPTINLLLPLYLDVFKELSIQPCFIVMRRDERAAARSLSKAEGLDEALALSLRKIYYDSLSSGIGFHKKIDVRYEDLIERPASFIDQINREFQTSLAFSDDGFVDKSLNHSGKSTVL